MVLLPMSHDTTGSKKFMVTVTKTETLNFLLPVMSRDIGIINTMSDIKFRLHTKHNASRLLFRLMFKGGDIGISGLTTAMLNFVLPVMLWGIANSNTESCGPKNLTNSDRVFVVIMFRGGDIGISGLATAMLNFILPVMLRGIANSSSELRGPTT